MPPIKATPPPAIEPVSYTYLGMKQLMAGGGIVLIGLKLIPLLANVLN